MLQNEFQERTGLVLTPEQYKEVEAMYNECSLDKDVFCKEWLQHKDDALVIDLYTRVNELKQRVEDAIKEKKDADREWCLKLNFEIERHEKAISRCADALLEKENDNGDDDLDEIIVEHLISRAELLRRKIDNDYELSSDDKYFIRYELLNNYDEY